MMKKLIAFALIVLCLVIFVAFAVTIIRNPPLENRTRENYAHTINEEASSGNWKVQWEQSNVYLDWLPWRQFAATDESICYIARWEEILLSPISLICLDIYDGKVQWTDKTNVGVEIDSDNNQIYSGGRPGIIAYDGETGQKVWQRTVEARSISDVIAYNGYVSVRGATNKFYVFDASNGVIQYKDEVPIMAPSSFASDGQKRFDQISDRQIEAHDIQDDSLIWRVNLDDDATYRPIFSKGVIFVRAGRQLGTLIAIDAETGHSIWEKEEVVSDFSVNDSSVFFITLHGELTAVDAETGINQGQLKLNSPELTIRNNETNNVPYFVRAINDTVIVYFGDTWQLFSFHFSKE